MEVDAIKTPEVTAKKPDNLAINQTIEGLKSWNHKS